VAAIACDENDARERVALARISRRISAVNVQAFLSFARDAEQAKRPCERIAMCRALEAGDALHDAL